MLTRLLSSCRSFFFTFNIVFSIFFCCYKGVETLCCFIVQCCKILCLGVGWVCLSLQIPLSFDFWMIGAEEAVSNASKGTWSCPWFLPYSKSVCFEKVCKQQTCCRYYKLWLSHNVREFLKRFHFCLHNILNLNIIEWRA